MPDNRVIFRRFICSPAAMIEVERVIMHCLNCSVCPLMWSATFRSIRLKALYHREIDAPLVLLFQSLRVELGMDRFITLSWVNINDDDLVGEDLNRSHFLDADGCLVSPSPVDSCEPLVRRGGKRPRICGDAQAEPIIIVKSNRCESIEQEASFEQIIQPTEHAVISLEHNTPAYPIDVLPIWNIQPTEHISIEHNPPAYPIDVLPIWNIQPTGASTPPLFD